MEKGDKIIFFLTICALFGLNIYSMSGNCFITSEKSYTTYTIKGNISQTAPAFLDDGFAPLMEQYRRKASKKLVPQLTKFRSGSVPRVLLWSDPLKRKFWEAVFRQVTEGYCPLPCEIIYDVQKKATADAIIIHLSGAKDYKTVTKNLSPRDPRQPWVMLTFEAPPYARTAYQTRFSKYNGLYNRTMTYRRDSDIVINHGFVVPKEDTIFLPQPWVVPPVMKVGNLSKNLAVAFISHCPTASRRMQYIREVQKYATVHIYGSCGDLKCGSSMFIANRYNATTDKCLKQAGETYLFYFAFENSFCKEYATEKVYNLLHYSIVPVVWGSANYSSILPPNSYVNANDYTPKELAERLMYLQDHPEEYQKYFEWKKYYQPSTVSGERIVCQMCSRLYEPEFYQYKVYEDFADWFVLKSNCMIMWSLWNSRIL
ncbi:alpha-(1,3)-fucosyltransferase C-like [Palaemon carinicauda]|uniref:alpha-(1,3)-fucosyltransferase C-like n=1 Tax=Palaemon carinicauda TaxID=392227 RepID=UPI0035B67FF4